jgi:hypothetical protein
LKTINRVPFTHYFSFKNINPFNSLVVLEKQFSLEWRRSMEGKRRSLREELSLIMGEVTSSA